MPEINVSVNTISKSIKKMEKNELETLLLLLTKEGKDLSSRKNDIIKKKVTLLSRDEVFDV